MTSSSTAGSAGQLAGSRLGDYMLLEKMAAGGMASIYRAEDVNLGRKAAVKVLAQDLLDTDETLTKRFKLEAKAVAAMDHPNIIPIYQYGEENDLYFIAMKLIEGQDFADLLNELKRQGKLIPPRRMIDILKQVAAALDFAHQQEIIHRDVKPSNILLTPDDKAVLTDFGLALVQRMDKTQGTAFGTPRYISPEQALASEKAGPQADIYSLAVIVYEALTGSMVFKADTAMQIAISHINEPPPSPRAINPNIPLAVEREVLKALEKTPKRRHKTATEFIEAVEAGYGGLIDTQPDVQPELLRQDTPVFKQRPDMHKIAAAGPPEQAWVDDWTTISTDESKAKGRSRLRPLLLLVVLVLVGAGIAFAVMESGLLDGDEPGSVAPEPTVPAAAIAPTEAATPTETPPPTATNVPVALVGGEPVSVQYDFNALAFRNDGETALDLSAVAFARLGDAAPLTSSLFSQTTLEPGDCLVITAQSTSRIEIPAAWDCAEEAISLNLRSPFWRADASDSFQVRVGEQIVATCEAIARGDDGSCSLNWPVTLDE